MLWVVGFLMQDRSGCLPVHFLSINPWEFSQTGWNWMKATIRQVPRYT